MFGAGNGLIGPPDPNRFFNLNELVSDDASIVAMNVY